MLPRYSCARTHLSMRDTRERLIGMSACVRYRDCRAFQMAYEFTFGVIESAEWWTANFRGRVRSQFDPGHWKAFLCRSRAYIVYYQSYLPAATMSRLSTRVRMPSRSRSVSPGRAGMLLAERIKALSGIPSKERTLDEKKELRKLNDLRRKRNKSPSRSSIDKHEKNKNNMNSRLNETPEKRLKRLDAVAESNRKRRWDIVATIYACFH